METLILIFFDICLAFCLLYVRNYIKHFVELQFEKDKCYESEKGKNLATKEDIEDITSKIESVKNEISFEVQRNHEFIKEREKRFLNILFYAETITNCINRLYVYGHNNQDSKRVYELVDEIAKTALLARQESTVCIAAYSDVLKGDKCMTNLVDDLPLLSAELLTKAHNVAINIDGYKYMFSKAQNEDGKSKLDTLQRVMYIGMQNTQLLEKPLEYKDVVNNDIDNYVLWLNRLYTTGLAIRYKVELIKDPIQTNQGDNSAQI